MQIAIGKIVKTFGTQGYVKIIPYAGIAERFLDLKIVYIETEEGASGLRVEDCRVQGEMVLMKFARIDTREAAAELLQKEILLPEEQKISLPEDSYFIHDLIGLNVYDEQGRFLGVLEEVLTGPGNDVYVVRQDGKELLIPAVEEFVREVDIAGKKMVVNLIEGMEAE